MTRSCGSDSASHWRRIGLGLALALVAFPTRATAQPGVYLPGAGATHAGMAGVSTATPIDALGALYWNPAAIGRLGRNEVSIGGAFVYPEIYLSSSRPRLNGTVASGRTRSDNGFPLIPSLGVVSKLDEERPFTFGTGLVALGGGGVNFPGDVNNPILSPTGPLGQVVLGPTFANMQLLQLNPTLSYQVTGRLVVGVGPPIDITPRCTATGNSRPRSPSCVRPWSGDSGRRRHPAPHPRVATAREPPGRAPRGRHRGLPHAGRSRRRRHHRRPAVPE